MARQKPAHTLRFCAVALLFGVFLLAGCHHARHLTRTQKTFREGDLVKTQENLETLISKRSSGSMAVITWLEAATICQAYGEFAQSNRYLDQAINLMEHYERQSPVRVLNETKAALMHQGLLTYEGRGHDRIFAYTLRALNNMFLGNWDDVRQDLMTARRAQQDAKTLNAARIARMQAQTDMAREHLPEATIGYDLAKATEDEILRASVQRLAPGESLGEEESLEELVNRQASASYENPFAEWLRAVYNYSCPETEDHLGDAEDDFERALEMSGENKFLRAGLEATRKKKNNMGPKPATWVIFATGTAPHRRTIRLDLPVFLIPGRVDYVGAAFPYLQYNDVFDKGLSVTTGDGDHATTILIADVDEMVRRNYWDEFPAMLSRTLLSTAIKTMIAYGVNQNTRDNELLNYTARIVMTAYQIQHNQADLRTWSSLPKQIQICRVPTPEDGNLTLRTEAGRPLVTRVVPGTDNLVHVRSVTPHTRPLATSVPLCRNIVAPSAVAAAESR